MKNIKNVPDWLIIGMNIAMLGMIHNEIRLIRVEYNETEQSVSIFSYLSRNTIEDDHEDLEEIATELDAMVGNYFNKINLFCIHSEHTTTELNNLSGAVFRRKE